MEQGVKLEVIARRFLDFAAPISEQYGTGEVYADLMLIIFVGSLLILLLLLLFSSKADKQVSEPAGLMDYSDIANLVTEIRAEVKRTLGANRADIEFIKHELVLIREQIAEVSDSAPKRSTYHKAADLNSHMEPGRTAYFNK